MLGTLIKIALACGLLGVIVAQTSIAHLTALWGQLSLPWLLGSVLAFYAMIWTMARRYWLLIDGNISFSEFLSLVILQTIVSNLVATSAGALSYLVSLRNKHQIATHQAIASLLVSRLGDMLALLVALVCASWAVWPQITLLHWLVEMLIAGLIGILLAAALAVVLRQRFLGFIDRIARLLGLKQFRIFQRVLQTCTKLAQYSTQLTPQQVGLLIIYSMLTLVFTFFFAYCNVRMFMMYIDVRQALFILVLTQIMIVIPIQVFGGLGVYDITTLYLYSLFGFDQSQIAAIIIGIRLMFYFINALMFLYVPIQGWLHHNLQQPMKPS